IYKDKILRMLQIGVPAGLQSVLFSISNVLIQSSINSFGATVVAGNSAAANIEGFVYVAMNAFYQANISFTSQNMGAGKYHRLNRILFTAQGCVILTGLLTGISCYVAGPVLLTLYTNSADVVAAGMVRLGYICLPYFIIGIMEVMVGSLRGMGYAVFPMIVSLVGSCLLRIVWLQTVFQIDRFHSIDTVYLIYPISWIVTAIAHIITYVIVKRKLIRK
ncbi:MAG: MATE family efflux transporter, partial [Lachnospiraceae bacterium]|nr:MATE family efflux transporter [Lachnospiraceae bacterium]